MYGHEAVRAELEVSLPPVALFRGPRGVGKRTLAQHLLSHHGVCPVDAQFVAKLSADGARDLVRFVATRPFGPAKAAVVRLDGASEVSLNVLLKTLEEPPDRMHFLLLAEGRTLPTVESRSRLYRFGQLGNEELVSALVDHGMAREAAEQVAPTAHGSVAKAMEAGPSPESKAIVQSALKSLADRDMARVTEVMNNWTDESQDLILNWCVEAATRRWRWFSEDETFGISGLCAIMPLYRDLSRPGRPKIVARQALTVAMRRK